MRVAIVGAGISGLALAYHLQKLGVPYDLFEAGSHVGGNIRTLQAGDYLLELGPNAVQYSSELEELIRDLKLEKEVLPATGVSTNRYVLREGTYQKLPSTPLSLLSNNFFHGKRSTVSYRKKTCHLPTMPTKRYPSFLRDVLARMW
ncbi:hypothetical protein GCM10028895_45770 [Pontibacter rugosus]